MKESQKSGYSVRTKQLILVQRELIESLKRENYLLSIRISDLEQINNFQKISQSNLHQK